MNSQKSSLPITLSAWVNEPLPNFLELLTARDVARLTRRPRWLLKGLSWMGRFPAQQRYRGRAIGWRRVDILEWLASGLEAANDPLYSQAVPPECRPHQEPLPLVIAPKPISITSPRESKERASGTRVQPESAEMSLVGRVLSDSHDRQDT